MSYCKFVIKIYLTFPWFFLFSLRFHRDAWILVDCCKFLDRTSHGEFTGDLCTLGHCPYHSPRFACYRHCVVCTWHPASARFRVMPISKRKSIVQRGFSSVLGRSEVRGNASLVSVLHYALRVSTFPALLTQFKLWIPFWDTLACNRRDGTIPFVRIKNSWKVSVCPSKTQRVYW